MELNLKRPIVFFDIETTGLNILADRIIELAYIKVYPNGKEEEQVFRFNPEMPIPPSSTAIHHITDDDVRDKPTFKQMAKQLAEIFVGCDIAGFNSNLFDVPMLVQQLFVVGVDIDVTKVNRVDVQTIFHKKERRDLAAAVKFYCGTEMQNHHSALADVRATYDVLKAQLDRYPTLQNDVAMLAEYSSFNQNVDIAGRIILDKEGHEVFNFGKYKGQRVDKVFATDTGYYGWILNGDFTEETKRAFTRIKLRISGKS